MIVTVILSAFLGAASLNTAYEQFPLGDIKPQGWLKETLIRQRDGLSSRMDEVYPQVMGPRNGWLGGDGDQWERGPYWIDGLLPLAYILDDAALKEKVQPWIEWTLQSQQPSGQFGPMTDYSPEKGIQRTNAQDWWPRMVMLKIMRQYYEATQDDRILAFLSKYFHFQLENLPGTPLDHWTNWALYRQCDNMSVALWLYTKTGDEKLLELANLLHKQGFDFVRYFEEGNGLRTQGSIHCVNLAQGFKEPVVFWQLDPQQRYLDAVWKGINDMKTYMGYPTGMCGADEMLHSNNPTQGTELCSVVEYMLSLEEMMRITGNPEFADLLERVAYNALPVQITDDFMAKQYYQQVNQVMVKAESPHNFDCKQEGTALDFGILSGYPCCLSNFHQGWPKFVQNLWLKGEGNTIAIMTYGPSSLETSVDGVAITLTEQTAYPMLGKVRISVSMRKRASAGFNLQLRIPAWCKCPSVVVCGESVDASGKICSIDREWKNGDAVELDFPMEVEASSWYERSLAIERGPLLYALKIEEKWQWHNYSEGLSHGISARDMHLTPDCSIRSRIVVMFVAQLQLQTPIASAEKATVESLYSVLPSSRSVASSETASPAAAYSAFVGQNVKSPRTSSPSSSPTFFATT